ncbi:MAG: glycosyltransferase, partial [Methylococcaceae bacterium]|nr:glycosyltransferase [Methylococcaceae bacterium]
ERQLLQAASAIPVRHRFPVYLTNLAYLTWLGRDDLRSALPDLANPLQQLSLIAWHYLQGVHEYRFYDYLSDGEIAVLIEPLAPSEQHGDTIPGWLLLAWVLDATLRGNIDINSATGCHQLVDWGERQGRERFRIDELIRAQRNSPTTHGGDGRGESSPNVAETGNPLPAGEGRVRAIASNASRSLSQAQSAPGVNLVGYAAGELGIGEDVRMMVKSLLTTDIPFCVINRKPSSNIRQADDSILRYVSEQPIHPITIICMTGFDTVQLALERPDVFDGKYVVGYWPWELPEWPKDWHVAYDLVDEIWASSRYTQSAYENSSPKPIRYMPMTVSFDAPGDFRKSDFGLPEDRFLFLFAFDFMSYPSRKNPEGCLEAFQTAFPDKDEKVGLVLKVSNVDLKDRRWSSLAKRCKVDPRITLLSETLDRRRVLGLMAACDAYVSLHRAEGFGRTLAEAMLLGKPVIATDYSGSTDFVSDKTGFPVPYQARRVKKGEYPFAEGMQWADPDTAAAAQHFRSILAHPEAHTATLADARRLIETNYGATTTGRNYEARITELTKIARG